jgi:hypothetical protein
MAELTAARRNKLPKSKFGLPGREAYPVDTKGRAANAKGRAKQQLKRGTISQSSYEKIIAKANRKLGPGHHA